MMMAWAALATFGMSETHRVVQVEAFRASTATPPFSIRSRSPESIFTVRTMSTHTRARAVEFRQPSSISSRLDATMPGSTTSSVIVASEAAVSNFAKVVSSQDLDASSSLVQQLPASTTIVVFAIGLAPFLIATYEFWRRIARGKSFGTGSDQVQIYNTVIGQDGDPQSSRGRRVLGKGALTVAYVLFGVSAAVLGLVLYSVLTTALPPPADVIAANLPFHS